MSPKIEEHHFQEITPILAEELSTTDVEDAMHYVGFPDIGDRAGFKKEARLNNFLRRARPTEKRPTVLAHLLDRADLSGSDRWDIQEALSGSGYEVAESDDGGLQLVIRPTPAAEEEAESHRTYLEEQAPPDVLDHLQEAKKHLAENEYEATCDELRRAADTMTTEGYQRGLAELEEVGLIERDPSDQGHHTYDYEMLYAPISYAGNVGSHTDSEYEGPSQLQATTAVILTEETIHFVLRKLEQASNERTVMEKWELPD